MSLLLIKIKSSVSQSPLKLWLYVLTSKSSRTSSEEISIYARGNWLLTIQIKAVYSRRNLVKIPQLDQLLVPTCKITLTGWPKQNKSNSLKYLESYVIVDPGLGKTK